MGGLRAAGDLVARMQLTRRMRLPEAKAAVADKLGVTPADLSDPVLMWDVRRDLGLGTIPTEDTASVEDALALEAKYNISRLLGIPIRSVERFRERTGAGAEVAARSGGAGDPGSGA